MRLHHIHQVVLIHHEECGAYGKESSLKRHEEDLRKAYSTLNTLYPDLQVKLFYLTLEGEFQKVSLTEEKKAKRQGKLKKK